MHLTAYGLLILTTLMWGGNSVAGKYAVGHVSPMLLTTLRWGLACAILYAVGHRQLRQDWVLVRAKLPILFLLGASGFALFNVALYAALNFTSAINVSIEQAGIPMVIFAANYLFFHQRVGLGQIVGFVAAVLGVALTAAHGEFARLWALDVNFGDALMIIAVLVYSAYTVLLRFRPAIHWLSLIIVLTGSAFLTSLPFMAAEWVLGHGQMPDATGWALVAYICVFPSIIAQLFYIRSVELIGPNRAGLFINLVPIFGTLLAIVLLGEAFYPYHAAALLLVLGGIAVAEWSERRLEA
ncbi:DMT family transporter [Mesorhizobium sp. RP14(2022)]|uniref:DMT family transporter n=1 Tax=Mesorhizobium liriopis TaxID=2953882 RepID=A0ABT1C055_9HYPH|nr:DMT family transporter [Mesorhizobium liriopis]MCO6048207.1 DMT family transporter [Mesorhizobium liriopis]